MSSTPIKQNSATAPLTVSNDSLEFFTTSGTQSPVMTPQDLSPARNVSGDDSTNNIGGGGDSPNPNNGTAYVAGLTPMSRGSFVDPAKFKTRLCRNHRLDIDMPCPFGDRCVFAHGETQLRAMNSASQEEFVSATGAVPLPPTSSSSSPHTPIKAASPPSGGGGGGGGGGSSATTSPHNTRSAAGTYVGARGGAPVPPAATSVSSAGAAPATTATSASRFTSTSSRVPYPSFVTSAYRRSGDNDSSSSSLDQEQAGGGAAAHLEPLLSEPPRSPEHSRHHHHHNGTTPPHRHQAYGGHYGGISPHHNYSSSVQGAGRRGSSNGGVGTPVAPPSYNEFCGEAVDPKAARRFIWDPYHPSGRVNVVSSC